MRPSGPVAAASCPRASGRLAGASVGVQTCSHTPLTHPCPPGQTRPQPPQSLTSVPSSTQAPPQSTKPALQLTPHTPRLHVGDPFAGVGQTFPHAPQLFGSVLSFWHTLPPPHLAIVMIV